MNTPDYHHPVTLPPVIISETDREKSVRRCHLRVDEWSHGANCLQRVAGDFSSDSCPE